MTAINDGKRDAQITDPVFISADCLKEFETNKIGPSDCGKGSVEIEYLNKQESKVEGLSNTNIQISHKLSKQEGIDQIISEYDTLTFRYSLLVEDGVTPEKVEVEATIGVGGVTLR